MDKLSVIILCFIAALMQGCAQHQNADGDANMNGLGNAAGEGHSYYSSYYIWKNEVRDTSFTLPRKILDDPAAFMKALTDVQMINLIWVDSCNYTEKLLFGDSILGKICREIDAGNGKPFFLIDNIYDEDDCNYYLNVKKGGDRSYTSYCFTGDRVCEVTWEMSEQYRKLLDDWNKKEMFAIAETDEERKKYVMSSGMVIYRECSSKDSGCITRLRCDKDSVYVDMVKLYLWALEAIPDEAREMETLKRREERLRKKARESEKMSCTMSTQSKYMFNLLIHNYRLKISSQATWR